MTEEPSRSSHPPGRPDRARRKRRTPLTRALPAATLDELNRALSALPRCTSAAVAEVHARLRLAERFEVSLRQTVGHARRLKRAGATQAAPTGDDDAGASAGLTTYRHRMRAIGEALSALVATAEGPNADVWGRGIFLKLIGRIYAALDCDELSLGDLQALSKIIYDQRRAQTQALEAERRGRIDVPDVGDDPVGIAPARTLPAHLGPMVRQVYGVDVPDGPARRPEERSPLGDAGATEGRGRGAAAHVSEG